RGGVCPAVRGPTKRSGVRRRVAPGQQGGQGVHVGVGRHGRGEDTAEVGLVDVAGGYVLPYAADARRVRGTVQGGHPVAGGGSPPGAGHGCRYRLFPDVAEACAGQPALEVGGDRPEPRGVQGRGVVGDVEEPGGEAASETGERREVRHVTSLWAGPLRWREQAQRSTLHKRVFVLAPESASVQFVAGKRKPTESTGGRSSVGRAQPCQG